MNYKEGNKTLIISFIISIIVICIIYGHFN